MDFCRAKHKKLTHYLEKLNKQEASEQKELIITGIDKIFTQIQDNLDYIEKTLKSTLQDLKERHHSLQNIAISLDSDYFDKVLFFWGEFTQLSLKKIKFNQPYDEIKKTYVDFEKKFINSLSRNKPDEREFKKQLNSKWFEGAQDTVIKINKLLDDTTHIWDLKINEELKKLEEFRKKNLPKEPKIPTRKTLKSIEKPILEEKLKIHLKTQGFIKMFVSQAEKQEWKKEAIEEVSKYVKKIMRQYELNTVKWLKIQEKNAREYLSDISKMGSDAIMALEENRTKAEKSNKEAVLFQRDIDTIEQNIDELVKKQKINHVMKEKWTEIKEISHQEN